jgi:ribonucleoside-diphosphate reductase alpha chain
MLSENAKKIIKDLYSLGTETVDETFIRTAKEFATNDDELKMAFDLQKNNIWRPNTPVYFNAGTDHKIFSACWVIGLEDTMESIYDVANTARKIFQSGAGIGIPIGNLREKEAFIYEGNPDKAPTGKSSGPVSFMKLYDAVGETTKSGGRTRRAAIMCSLPIWHPDIKDFITCKEIDGRLSNMNISVSITDKFMKALEDNVTFPIQSPSNGEQVGEMPAKEVWDKICEMAWRTGDPGVMFIDIMNKYNPLRKIKLVECTNPCGEQPLIPWAACNLSSINVRKFVDLSGKKPTFGFKALYDTAYAVMRLMDNLIDKMHFPDNRFRDTVYKYRPVGIGIMGLADTFFELGLAYDSQEARELAAEIMKTITTACVEASADLAKEKGKFDNYDTVKDDILSIVAEHIGGNKKVMQKVKEFGLRNYQFTTCPPTGTTALTADTSYGIEPSFGLVFQKHLMEGGGTMNMVNPVFKKNFEGESWYNETLLEKIAANGGSLKGLRGIPAEVRSVYVVAHDIKYKDRLDMQASLQQYCSSAISSTINLPQATTKEEISELYRYAYSQGLKGVTIYRDGSKREQPITFTKDQTQVKSNFKRPSKLSAVSHTIETGNGKMYVTISTHNNKPVEIFMSMGKSGQLFNVFSEALGRTISIALQHGVPLESIIKTLININSDRQTWYRFEETDQRPTPILSIPDGIAKLLQRYYINGGKADAEDVSDRELCPKCATYSIVLAEGCKTCLNCGLSECS